MKCAAVALALVAGLGLGGVGLEVAHPVVFSTEPMVVWTAGDVPPEVSLGGVPVPALWERSKEGDLTRWTGVVSPWAPLGVWMVCSDRSCQAVLRVSPDVGLVEVRAGPGALLYLAGQVRVADRAGWATFAVPPGYHELLSEFGGEPVRRWVTVHAGERTQVTLVLAQAGTSTPMALPGSTVVLGVSLVSPREFPALGAQLLLPPGWEAVPSAGVFDPVRAGELTVRVWMVRIPDSAALEEYTLAVDLVDLGVQAQTTLAVADRLPAQVVVCHWDVGGDQLNLALPCRITYNRLRWAATLVGQELPFTGRVFTQTELESLATEWQTEP